MKIIELLLLLALLTFLLKKMSKKSGPSRYDRKPSTPWSALNDGEDPSI
jgi:hypothetical protein